MLTPEQAFRVGFLTRCSEEGLSGHMLDARLDAAAEFAKTGGIFEDIVTGGAKAITAPLAMGTKGLGYAAVAGVLGGAGVGAGLGALSAPEDPGKIHQPPFLQDVQKAELAAAYRQQAAELKRLTELRRPPAQPTRSHYGI